MLNSFYTDACDQPAAQSSAVDVRRSTGRGQGGNGKGRTPLTGQRMIISRGIGTTIGSADDHPVRYVIMTVAIWLLVAIGIALLVAPYFSPAISLPISRHASIGGQSPLLATAWLLGAALLLLIWAHHRAATAAGGTARARIRRLAAHDPLTGLLNRRSFVERATTMLARHTATGGPMTVMLVGLDRLNVAPDGAPLVRDRLICRIADLISAELPAGALTAWYDDAMFACAIPADAAQHNMVARIAERIVGNSMIDGLDQCAAPIVSIGLASAPCGSGAATRPPGVLVDRIINEAEAALAGVREAGGAGFAWFDPMTDRAARARRAIDERLPGAIARSEFVPFFEQQVDLASGTLIGFEMLARWNVGNDAAIGPDLFIPRAERAGLVTELSVSLLRQAFLAALDWDPSLSLSINVAPAQLQDVWFAQKLLGLLAETHFPADRLEIDIAERAVAGNLALARSTLGSLRLQGIRLALDDFGTGEASLSLLRALPFDRIKIDTSLIGSVQSSSDSAQFVQLIAQVGESLSLRVSAEGIETREIERRVRALGCGQGQGYLYGRAASVANTRRLLAERRLLVGFDRQTNGGADRAAPVNGAEGSVMHCDARR